jgi:hypothetical protein
MKFSSGATMTLNKTSNPSVQGLVFTTGSSTTGSTNVMFATATYGNGRVCALGDSSVPDDGREIPMILYTTGIREMPMEITGLFW